MPSTPEHHPSVVGVGAIVLAGGRASRLGGLAKPLARFAGSSLLDLAIGAVPAGGPIVVVGPADLVVPAGVLLVREDPPFGGPVAALAAGLAAVEAGERPSTCDWLLVLAADQPTIDTSVRLLLAAERGADGVTGIDGTGHRQPLAALYRTAALRDVMRSNGSGPLRFGNGRMMDVAAALAVEEVFLGDRLDVDTADDVRHFGVELPDRSAQLPRGQQPLNENGHDLPRG